MIRELRILPPLGIARFGAAATPMDNYDIVVDPDRPLGYRLLRPARTLVVDEETGGIKRAFVPAHVTFTQDSLVRPVAPFFEVWVLDEHGELQPMTTQLLDSAGASITDFAWQVEVANHKVFRRTADGNDQVRADTGLITDHLNHPLMGGCVNFWPGKTIPLGSARFIAPTPAHPEIRLRFTPAPGFVYGASSTRPPPGAPTDANIRDVVYDASRGRWLGHTDSGWESTVPGQIFASDPQGASRGYLDDGCDGFIRVTLTAAGATLSAFARVAVGPPAYAPDGLPIRSVADELEQAWFGPEVDSGDTSLERVEDILRRAFETVRLMNTPALNRGGMAAHDAGEGRRRDPIMAPALVETEALQELHQSVLVALRSGAAPWFADVLRRYDDVGDLTDRGRRKMPAMMRGADGRHLALTRRQVALVTELVRGPLIAEPENSEQSESEGPNA